MGTFFGNTTAQSKDTLIESIKRLNVPRYDNISLPLIVELMVVLEDRSQTYRFDSSFE